MTEAVAETIPEVVTPESTIERDVKNFVASKTGERVFICLSEKSAVSVKHVRKSGSTILAIFWVKVLQHPNNYPMQHFPYRKLYSRGVPGEDRVVLSVDGVKVAVFMSPGTLQITGTYAVEWFVDRLRGIMAGYGAPPDRPQPLREIFTDPQRGGLIAERKKVMQSYRDTWPDEALAADVNVVEDGEKKSMELEKLTNPRLPDMVTDGHVYILSDPDVLPNDELDSQVERLKAGTLLEGHVLYRVWKSLLNLWFNDDQCEVYVVSPTIDSEILASLCRLYLNHRLTANLGAICVPLEFGVSKMAEIKRDTLLKFPPKDQVLVEYKVYEAIVYAKKRYEAKFIACVKDDEATILLTTADFHSDHFLQSSSETSVYQTLTKTEFMMKYLGPILSSADCLNCA